MSVFTKIEDWFKKEFTSVEKNAAHIAVVVAEKAKEALLSGKLDVLAQVIDFITKSNIGDKAEALLKEALPKIISVSIAIETFPTKDSTPESVLVWEKSLLAAFNVTDTKSMTYSLLASQTFGILQATLAGNAHPTFAEWMAAVEKIYQKFKLDTNS